MIVLERMKRIDMRKNEAYNNERIEHLRKFIRDLEAEKTELIEKFENNHNQY